LHDPQFYTKNAASLADSLSNDVTKASAIDFSKGQNPIAYLGLEQTAAALKETPAAGRGFPL
jgi:hypothetical protein